MPFYDACLGTQDIKRQADNFSFLLPPLMISFMWSPTNEDKLRQTYSAVLLHISRDLDQIQQNEPRFYCSERIPTEFRDSLNILRSLEQSGKISWDDVNFLKEALRTVGRYYLAKLLKTFEVRRDLTLLLHFYARNRPQLDLVNASLSMKTIARHLLTVVTEKGRRKM